MLKILEKRIKKLIAVLEISLLMTRASKKVLQYVYYIQYPVWFWKKQEKIKVLINLSSKVNTMTPAYNSKLGFSVRKIYFRAQKING